VLVFIYYYIILFSYLVVCSSVPVVFVGRSAESKLSCTAKRDLVLLDTLQNPDINLENTGTTEQIGYNALISTNYVFHTAKSDWNKKI
jgi:hypothetical protein